MDVSFYIGRSGSGKTYTVQEEIRQQMRAEPTGKPIIYLVPDQMTFQAEYALVQTASSGTTRAHVYSFSRLAWRVLQETGGAARYHIQNSGVHMLLRKIVEREKSQLKAFGRAADTTGFIQQLERMFKETKQYNLTPDTLQKTYETWVEDDAVGGGKLGLADKLHDATLIFQQAEEELAGKYVCAEDYLSLLAAQIPFSQMVQEATIYVDGFHTFTPQELDVIQALMAYGEEMTISLTLDRAVGSSHRNPLDLFYTTAKTYEDLMTVCNHAKATPCEPKLFTQGRRFTGEDIAHLEATFDQKPPSKKESKGSLHITSAVNRRAEIEAIARTMLGLVRDEGYRFHELAVLVRDLGTYSDLLETVLSDYEIPFFMDEKRSVLNHPLVELLRSVLEIIDGNWRYEAVFRALKTELLYPLGYPVDEMRERVDELENYVISYGIKGKQRFEQSATWQYRRQRTQADGERHQSAEEEAHEQRLHETKQLLLDPILTFENQVKKVKKVEERCRLLYSLLEELAIPQKIERLRDEAHDRGDLRRSFEHDQMWDSIIEMFDQLVEMAGDETTSIHLFRSMWDAGLESMSFAIVPPAIDQLTIADLDRSRLTGIKCAFLIGVNEGQLPKKPEDDGFLREEERNWLEEEGVEVAAGSTQQLLEESFLLYLAVSLPKDRLYLSYALADEEGRKLEPSPLFEQLKQPFEEVIENVSFNDPNEYTAHEQISFIQTPLKSLSFLTHQLQNGLKGYPISTVWYDTYNWFVENDRYKEETARVLSSLHFENQPISLDEDTSRKLYGEHVKTSVSRMETYQACSFAHFASHGLRLKERETYKLEAPDIGQLFHGALKEMAEKLRVDGRDFKSLTRSECERLAKTIVDDMAPKIQREILLSSHRYYYLKEKLEDVVARASYILSEQAKASGFSPIGLEVGFGPGEDLPPLQFNLDNGVKMELIGRIDRVDQATKEEEVLLRIVDYKSSAKDIDLAEVYYGLALQMLLYLDIVLSFSNEWLGTHVSPAGVLYFHVHNPIIQANEQLSSESIEEKLFKEFKMKGLLTGDQETVRLMDETLETGRSDIVPAGITKKGDFYSNSSVISPENYHALRTYLRKLVKQIGEAITNGDVSLNPYETKQQKACTFCKFAAVCQFDPVLETNQFRTLKPVKEKEIVEMMERKEEEPDE
ncbi:helicase-exonuclease AddAB subunit AddB [Salsuginibacillus kocurii]|uniref:helicase-exonuclease AddAB subunit AddB n=1 Tax=Salsuginibacillus kocurii TaxID=427078 RepID=UPI00036D809B|nr:helicase-exonuclease AddAB subunit AddB [Salsuginibacillus kocurii]